MDTWQLGPGIQLQYVDQMFGKDLEVYGAFGDGVDFVNVTNANIANIAAVGAGLQPNVNGISLSTCSNVQMCNVRALITIKATAYQIDSSNYCRFCNVQAENNVNWGIYHTASSSDGLMTFNARLSGNNSRLALLDLCVNKE